MITGRHTFEEIYLELEKETQRLVVSLRRNISKIRRFFLKKSSYPAWLVQDGETSGKNKYILYLECRSKKELSVDAIAMHVVWYYNNGGVCVAIFASDYDELDDTQTLYLFSPHVFSRYRMRFVGNGDISTKELIKLFFQNNLHVDWQEGIDEFHWEGVMKDGVLFAIRESRCIFHVKTFVTWDMLFESQGYMKSEMYDSLKEMMESGIKLPEELREKIEPKESIEDYIKKLQERMKNRKV